MNGACCGGLPDTFRPAYPSFCVLPEVVDAIGSRLAHSIHDELSWKAPSQGMRAGGEVSAWIGEGTAGRWPGQ